MKKICEKITERKLAMRIENKIIKKVMGDKRKYMNLLLLADEQEDMIEKYLDRGKMYVLDDNGVKAECVVTD